MLTDLGRFWEGPVAEDRTPSATARAERVGRVMLAAAMIWMGLVAAWGIAGPFPDGHFAATANIGTAAWNMMTFNLRYPVLWTAAHPAPGTAESTYMHHPLGVFWTAAVFIKIFGVHNWAIRLPAVISSTLCPLLVYRIGRAVWGPVEAGIGALTYVSLPITLGFSNFHALEGPVIVGLLVAIWGYVRYLQTHRERYAIASLVGYAWALNNDWPAYFWMFAFGGLLFLRNFLVPPRLSGALRYRAVGRYWAFLVGLTVASLVLIAYFTVDSGKLGDLYAAYTNRSSGNHLPLRKVLEARRGRRAAPARAPALEPGGEPRRRRLGEGAQAGREGGHRQSQVRGEVLRPEDVHVGPLLEIGVLDGRHHEQWQRDHELVPAPPQRRPRQHHHQAELAEEDRQPREHELNPDVAGLEHLAERQLVAVGAVRIGGEEVLELA